MTSSSESKQYDMKVIFETNIQELRDGKSAYIVDVRYRDSEPGWYSGNFVDHCGKNVSASDLEAGFQDFLSTHPEWKAAHGF